MAISPLPSEPESKELSLTAAELLKPPIDVIELPSPVTVATSPKMKRKRRLARFMQRKVIESMYGLSIAMWIGVLFALTMALIYHIAMLIAASDVALVGAVPAYHRVP